MLRVLRKRPHRVDHEILRIRAACFDAEQHQADAAARYRAALRLERA
jgi:hypothetical protein